MTKPTYFQKEKNRPLSPSEYYLLQKLQDQDRALLRGTQKSNWSTGTEHFLGSGNDAA